MEKGFLGSLFDLSFSSFMTTKRIVALFRSAEHTRDIASQ